MDGDHQQIWNELRAIDATVTNIQTTLTNLAVTFAAHTAAEENLARTVNTNSKRVDSLWDWRNRILGAVALIAFLLTSGIAAILIKVYG